MTANAHRCCALPHGRPPHTRRTRDRRAPSDAHVATVRGLTHRFLPYHMDERHCRVWTLHATTRRALVARNSGPRRPRRTLLTRVRRTTCRHFDGLPPTTRASRYVFAPATGLATAARTCAISTCRYMRMVRDGSLQLRYGDVAAPPLACALHFPRWPVCAPHYGWTMLCGLVPRLQNSDISCGSLVCLVRSGR